LKYDVDDRRIPFPAAARIDRTLAQVCALANHRRGLVPSTWDRGEKIALARFLGIQYLVATKN
jgi:hypothetical protein